MGGDLFRKLRVPWLGRREIEAEFEDELAHHLEMRERELIEGGMSPEEASASVRRTFGDVRRTRAGYVSRRARALRGQRLRAWLAGARLDLRVAVRSLRRRPTFSAAAVVVLAIGIGAPTTVFSLVDAIFFARPAHVVEPHRLVRVFRSWAPGEGGGTLQNADYVYYRDNATTFSGLAAYGGAEVGSYRWAGGDPGQLSTRPVSANYFHVLGVPPVLGRTFRPEENEVPGGSPVAVLSHGFWTRALGGAENVLDGTLEVNGIAFTVIGVAPEGFTGISPVESAPDAWIPIAMAGAVGRIDPEDTAWWERHPRFVSRWLDVVGRVSDGLTVQAATANLESLAAALDYPGKDPNDGVLVTPQFLYRPSQEASLGTLSRVLLAVVGIVLLVAAANVAVLLLSRATTRWEEIGIRSAIGAGRARIMRQLVVESVVLGAAGGVLGIALAYALSGAAGSLLPLPFHTEFTLSPAVLATAVALTLTTSVAVGIGPAIHGARADVSKLIRSGAPGAKGVGARGALVVVQVALSLVLLSGAFLFTQSFWSASTEDIGFDRRAGLVARVELRGLGYDAERGRRFIADGIERLRATPGVEQVTTTRGVPFGGQWSTDLEVSEGGTATSGENTIEVGLNAVSPDYFRVMGIDVVAGRPIDERDVAGSTPAVVVNETLAELLWPGEEAVGRTAPARGMEMTVVGVARDAVYYELGENARAYAYFPVQQVYQSTVHFLVRSAPEASVTLETVQSALRELEPGLAFARVTTMESIVEDELARYEVSAVLVGLFGIVALVLMATGLYGVVAFGVARKSHEIGIRMALGADRGRVARGVLASGLRLVAVGGIIGLAGALALRGYTASLLYGVEPTNPVPLVIACLSLLVITSLASSLPARRAMNVDPVDAIRAE